MHNPVVPFDLVVLRHLLNVLVSKNDSTGLGILNSSKHVLLSVLHDLSPGDGKSSLSDGVSILIRVASCELDETFISRFYYLVY